ncbi:YcjF family protein [Sporomusa sp.]|uniref:YcjF family protein n=1 Tax=Sporomusa sp. TaxID=2078658 RepID=UPI002D097E02|nr:DUF697 domain-containing protein [Sporomusa sp.]HWR08947.1 DUF697 domain-containing protein [Sporomusa sp.]
MKKGLTELMFSCFFLSKDYKEDLYKIYGNAAVFTDKCENPYSCQLEPDELLPGELTAVTFTVGCYIVRSALRVYKACDNLGLEIPADKEELDCVQADLRGGSGLFSPFSPPWHDRLRVTSEISAKHSSDPYGIFTNGFKYICRGGHNVENELWSHSIGSICTLKKNILLSDNAADLLILHTNHYFTATSSTWYSLNPQGVLTNAEAQPEIDFVLINDARFESKINDIRYREIELEKMIEAAKKAVAVAVATAAGIGAIPIPFADLPILIGNQVALMASIAVIFKIDIKKDGLKTLVMAALGVGGVAILGRAIFTNLFKFIPGIGSLIGGAISASAAGIITYGIGMAFIKVCKAIKVGKLQEEDITSKEGKAIFKEYFTSFAKSKTEEVS